MERPHHILVADDSVINQAVVTRMLEHAGYRVDAVHNGEEVISALERGRYDLVIMDCLMPVMDGFAATRAIRRSDPDRLDPQIPIVAITALATEDHRRKCLDAGMTDHLSKPTVLADLHSMISRLLGRPAGPTNARPPSQAASPAAAAAEAQARFQADVLRNMSDRIASEAEQWRIEIAEHRDAGKLDDLRQLAHKIRGAADVIGRTRLSQLAERLEVSAAAEAPRVNRLVSQLLSELESVALELRSGDEVTG